MSAEDADWAERSQRRSQGGLKSPLCCHIFLAEFDIDKGSALKYQYPTTTNVDEHLLAEHMLPDGAHDRNEDWTVFYLNQIPPLSITGTATTGLPHSEATEGGAGAEEKLLYVVSLVRTKKVATVRRGALVKALAIATPYPFIQIFKPLLVLALDAYFSEPSLNPISTLFTSLNSIDFSLLPHLSLPERLILRASDRTDVFEEKFDEEDLTLQASSGGDRGGQTSRESRPKDTHWFETKVGYEGMMLPLRIPLATFPEEVGDYSLIKLIQTFHTLVPSPLHPHLHSSGPQTPPIILLFNAILTEKRVVFLGHGLPAGDVAALVLAACAVATGGGTVFDGVGRRAFPYTNLVNLDNLQTVPGFIAGVCNPAFADRPGWWDVLCNIETGKITVSKDLQCPAIVAGQINGGEAGGVDEDVGFMDEINNAISAHYGEPVIRARFADYATKFVRQASKHDDDKSIGYPCRSFGAGNGGLGSGYVGGGDEGGGGGLIASGRIEGWKGTRGYRDYQKAWKRQQASSPLGNLDLPHQLARLRTARKLPRAEVEAIVTTLASFVRTDEQVIAILGHLPPHFGGLLPITFGLFHPSEAVRFATVDFLDVLVMHPTGRKFIATLNAFHRAAYYRLTEERPQTASTSPRVGKALPAIVA